MRNLSLVSQIEHETDCFKDQHQLANKQLQEHALECPTDKEYRKKHSKWWRHAKSQRPQTHPLMEYSSIKKCFPNLSPQTPHILYSHWNISLVATKDRDFRTFTAFHGWMKSCCLEILYSAYPLINWWTFKLFRLLSTFNNIVLWMFMHKVLYI